MVHSRYQYVGSCKIIAAHNLKSHPSNKASSTDNGKIKLVYTETGLTDYLAWENDDDP